MIMGCQLPVAPLHQLHLIYSCSEPERHVLTISGSPLHLRFILLKILNLDLIKSLAFTFIFKSSNIYFQSPTQVKRYH